MVGKKLNKLLPLVLVFFYIMLSPPIESGASGAETIQDGRQGGMGQGVGIRVLWTVSGYQMLDGARMDEKKAKELLFKPLDIQANSITFNGKTCRDINSSRKPVSATEYLLQHAGIAVDDIGIGSDTITVVSTTCTLPGFSEYVRLPDRRLLVFLEGVLFFFEPLVN